MLSLSSIQAQNTESRNLNSFDGIEAGGSFDIELVQSSNTRIEISSNIETHNIVTKIVGSTLHINYAKSANKLRKKNTDIVLYYDEIKNIDLSASTEITSDAALKTKSLEIDMSSGSALILEIRVEDIEIDMSSGANVHLTGQCYSQEIDMSSGSRYKAYDLSSDEANLDLSSGASAKVSVKNKLDAEASSGASIRYHGDPQKVNVHRSSGGSVRSSN